MSFKGKIILITGGSAGIGEATAKQFAREQATIVIVGRNEDRLMAVALACKNTGAKVLKIKADITSNDEAKRIVEKTIEEFGRIDVLVNNAGILRKSSILDSDFLEVYDEIAAVNMRAVVRLTYFAVPHIIKTKGNIINISSIAATKVTIPDFIAYRTNKAALNHFTRALSVELAPHGVRVNSVSPGIVYTDIYEGVKGVQHDLEALRNLAPLKKMAEPQEIADVVVFLAGDKAGSISGADYLIDNGVGAL